MGGALDLMENAFNKITVNNTMILGENFMMEIFLELSNNVDPFKGYLEYMFSEKLSDLVTSGTTLDDKVLPYELLKAAQFSSSLSRLMSCVAILEVKPLRHLEFQDETKVTHNYLSSICSKYSLSSI